MVQKLIEMFDYKFKKKTIIKKGLKTLKIF